MCGACGTHSVKDWSWPWLADSRSTALIARAAGRLSRIHGIRILPASSGWQVLMPTGSTQLVDSVTMLARVAQIDGAGAPEVSFAAVAEASIVDRRRPISVRVANPGEPLSAAAHGWPDALLSPETTVVTIDGTTPSRALRALHDLALTASLAPCRDHLRLLPIKPELMPGVVVHPWADLPDAAGSADLPLLCLSLAARLAALPSDDLSFREARIRLGNNGSVRIQSVGATVTAMDVAPADPFE